MFEVGWVPEAARPLAGGAASFFRPTIKKEEYIHSDACVKQHGWTCRARCAWRSCHCGDGVCIYVGAHVHAQERIHMQTSPAPLVQFVSPAPPPPKFLILPFPNLTIYLSQNIRSVASLTTVALEHPSFAGGKLGLRPDCPVLPSNKVQISRPASPHIPTRF